MVLPEQNWILYDDETLLAVNKPAGLPALPDGYHPDAPHVKRLLEPQYGRLWIVHRLDRQTSGLMLLARSPQAHRALNDQFQSHQMNKTYHALIVGLPPWDETVIDLALRPDGDRRHRTVIDQLRGKPASTHLRLLERFGSFSLVQAVPRTGRTHQLRAHLSAAGFPILCDALYGGGQRLVASLPSSGSGGSAAAGSGLLERMGLHAWSLEFQHPVTHSQMRLEAPYPADFERTLGILRRFLASKVELLISPR
jgi:RluA family pseudouridine synthase